MDAPTEECSAVRAGGVERRKRFVLISVPQLSEYDLFDIVERLTLINDPVWLGAIDFHFFVLLAA